MSGASVVSIRELLFRLTAIGGLDAPGFLEDELRRAEQELRDLLGRMNDRRLRRDGGTSSSRERGCGPAPHLTLVCAPGPSPNRPWRALEVEEAHRCIDLIETTLACVNHLAPSCGSRA